MWNSYVHKGLGFYGLQFMPVTIEPINPFLQSNLADIEILGSVDDPYVKYSFFESLTWPPYAPHVLQPTPKVKLG